MGKGKGVSLLPVRRCEMTRHLKKMQVPVSFLLLLLMFVGCVGPSNTATPNPTPTPTPTPTFQKTHIYIRGVMAVGGDGEPIELINNPNATNPTYAELLAFIKRDRTDEYSYIFGPPKVAYTCGDFAEDVHNNAESAGIRAAWVGIDVYGEDEGHACNAFETTDMGLVYLDCTGKGLWSETSSDRNSWDKQAYVKIGEAYQVTDVDSPKSRFVFVVGIKEYIDEVMNRKEWTQESSKILDWVRRHDVRELGLGWVQDWMQEHNTELSKCGRVLEPFGNYGAQNVWGSEFHHIASGWLVRTDCLEVPWFQSQTEVVDVDGIPVTWKVSWSWSMSGFESLGRVTDIHINW